MDFSSRRAWVVFAFLTLLFYGVSNFMSGVIGEEAAESDSAGKSNSQAQLLTQGVAGVFATGVLMVSRGTGAFFRDRRATAALIVAGAILAAGIVVLATTLATDFNMAPFITGVLPVNAVFLVLPCYIVLGERTTGLQLTAITVAVAGLAVMATADTSGEGIVGLLWGVLVAVCFAAGNFCIKFASLRGMDHPSALCLLYLSMGLVGSVLFAAETLANGVAFAGLGELNDEWGGGERRSSHRLYWYSLLSGTTQMLAIAAMKLTVSLGPAAPGMASQ